VQDRSEFVSKCWQAVRRVGKKRCLERHPPQATWRDPLAGGFAPLGSRWPVQTCALDIIGHPNAAERPVTSLKRNSGERFKMPRSCCVKWQEKEPEASYVSFGHRTPSCLSFRRHHIKGKNGQPFVLAVLRCGDRWGA